MICFRFRPLCHQRVLPLPLLLLLLSATLVDSQQTVTADEVEEDEEVEEETTTLLPEQHEVAFGFIYSKEFRVRTKQHKD